jgi:hypothetical protein
MEVAMARVSGPHHVQLAAPAGSEPEMRKFFGGILGLTEADKPADLAARGGVWFRGLFDRENFFPDEDNSSYRYTKSSR